MKLLNAQVVRNTCRTFTSNIVKPYSKYGRYVWILLRAHKQSTSFAAPYLKHTKRASLSFVFNLCTEFDQNGKTVQCWNFIFDFLKDLN
jgi:hypothetical protein